MTGGDHTIRFDAVDYAGNRSICSTVVYVSGPSTVPRPPAAFAMGRPFPNPFAAAASIAFALPESVPVRLLVLSPAGQLVATITDRLYEPGEYSISWPGFRDDGSAAPNGIYFMELVAGKYRATRRVALVR